MAQNENVQLAGPGDSVATPGPRAKLSPAINRTDLAKAMKLVGDWQLKRLPQEAQYDWTFAALYAAYMAVPDEAGGDSYRKAMTRVAEQLNWQPGPRAEHADDQAVGQLYLALYQINRDKKEIEPMRARLDQEIATPDNPAKPL